jgi:putative membrane protein
MRRAARLTFMGALLLAGCGGSADENATTANGLAVVNGASEAGNGTTAPAAPATAAQYVALASGGDLYEIESARLALEKATSQQVKGLAEMILADHQRSTRQLAEAAGQASPPLALAAAMSADQQAGMDILRRTNGRDFDTTWLRQQVLAHQQAFDAAAHYASRGDVQALRRHAASTIEPIQRHLTRARSLEAEALAQPAP